MKIQKNKLGVGGGGRVGGGGGGVRVGGGGQGGCEWRSEAFVKIQKKIFIFFGGVGSGQGGRVGGGLGWMGTEN